MHLVGIVWLAATPPHVASKVAKFILVAYAGTILVTKALGLPGGTLAEGGPGDVTILDLEREVVVEPRKFRSRSRNCPFAGWELTGAAAATVVGGEVKYRAE